LIYSRLPICLGEQGKAMSKPTTANASLRDTFERARESQAVS